MVNVHLLSTDRNIEKPNAAFNPKITFLSSRASSYANDILNVNNITKVSIC